MILRLSHFTFYQIIYSGHICKIEKSSELKCWDIGSSASSAVCAAEMRDLQWASSSTLPLTFFCFVFKYSISHPHLVLLFTQLYKMW